MLKIEDLNQSQKRAVSHTTGPLMVVAGAGTGKTAIIALRIAQLIKKLKNRGQNILALTFTDKASEEMEERVDQLLPYGYTDVNICTFHALGDKILKEYGAEIGISSDFTIMTGFQQIIMMQNVISKLRLSYHKPLGDPYSFVSDLIGYISRLKDEYITPLDFKKFVDTTKIEDIQEAKRLRELVRIYQSYTDTCYKQQSLDFGDLIVLSINILENRPSVAKLLRKQYEYILVDEYQDTNYAQSRLLRSMVGGKQNIMVVGDDDQSIYRFRGAAISNILGFMDEYPSAQQIVIRHNYRSSQKILNKAYKLIQYNNPYRLEIQNKINKKLIGYKQEAKIEITNHQDILGEIDDICAKIMQLIKTEKIQFSDIAILIRKNSQSKQLASALLRSNIPYVVSESQNLLEQPEIKMILNFINVINDPGASDAFYGLLVSDMFQCSLDQLADISSKARREKLSLEKYLSEAVANASIPSQCVNLLELIGKYREHAKEQNAGTLIYQFIKDTGYMEGLIKDSHINSVSAQKITNITQFFSIVAEFEQINRFEAHIYALWQHLKSIRDSGADIMIRPSPLDINAVRIMTIHKAKGLEFEAVFVPDMTEQTFPSTRRVDRIRVPEGLLTGDVDNAIDWNIHEERRLLYVAITRAKKYLYLSYSFDHGKKRLKKPSRFISELSTKPLAKPNQNIGIATNTSIINSFEQLPREFNEPLKNFISEDGWLHISTNQLASYLRSPKEFWYFDVLNLPKGPFHTLVYGSAVHAALEYYYTSVISGRPASVKQVIDVYKASWSREGFVSFEHQHDRYMQGQKVIRRIYSTDKKSKRYPVFVEKPFKLKLDDLKLVISGRYDAIYNDDSKIEIRDFKTGDVSDQVKADKRLKESLQMKIYALAWTMNESLPLESLSLYFVETDITANSSKINNEKTISTLQTISDNIRARRFEDKGQSRLNFGVLM